MTLGHLFAVLVLVALAAGALWLIRSGRPPLMLLGWTLATFLMLFAGLIVLAQVTSYSSLEIGRDDLWYRWYENDRVKPRN